MKIMIETDMTEMPKGCGECREKPFCREWNIRLNDAFIGKTGFEATASAIRVRPDWCPLREVEDEPT